MANYPEFVNEEGYLTNEPAIVRAAAAKIGADHVSVSYTHLDVYKRQLLSMPAMIRMHPN